MAEGDLSGRNIRKVGRHPKGGNFGQGPPLTKNENGRGYHYTGAPGFEDEEDAANEVAMRWAAIDALSSAVEED